MKLSQLFLIVLTLIVTAVFAFADIPTIFNAVHVWGDALSRKKKDNWYCEAIGGIATLFVLTGLTLFLVGTIGIIMGENPFYSQLTSAEIIEIKNTQWCQVCSLGCAIIMALTLVISYILTTVYIVWFLANKLVTAYEKNLIHVFIWITISCGILINVLGAGIYYLKEIIYNVWYSIM